VRSKWIVRRHVAGGDIDTLHKTYEEARRVEREAIEAARTHYGLTHRITLYKKGGRK
jgi:hypothetical protein